MATSVQLSSSSPVTLIKESGNSMDSSTVISPSSDSSFWSALRNRVDTLLENRKAIDQSLPVLENEGKMERAKRLKEDSLLLLRGFDSVSNSLSQLSGNLDNALQGARELSRPPTLSQIVCNTVEKAKAEDTRHNEEEKGDDEETEEGKRGVKRKECTDDEGDKAKENGQSPYRLGNFKKAKNIAITMAKKATSIARELKSVKSDLSFLQERCSLLEEENRRLRDGFAKGIRPEEDDLMRLQMEALLAEKSRLANENASLTRENQCLNQLVEYHQVTSQDLSESYENDITGVCLDFSSFPPTIPEEEEESEDVDNEVPKTPLTDRHGFSFNLS
ncbi:F-box/WD repeat-containing 10 [Heracleum sosnowskyi]|uniref:F-box/WD repeat-containing 10 n=1 Tax=Heracleum sosnowskyi TaxID=360622 RepID=A0AAD8MH20_9APIA|nr:F-box/WD repeat-containing 10 [Heracleum sosnowskyi]